MVNVIHAGKQQVPILSVFDLTKTPTFRTRSERSQYLKQGGIKDKWIKVNPMYIEHYIFTCIKKELVKSCHAIWVVKKTQKNDKKQS